MSLYEVRGMGDEWGNKREREKDTRSSVWGMCSQKDNEEQGTRRSQQWQFQRPFAGGHCDWTA